MIDIEKQTAYWVEGSREAMRTVPTLEREGFYAEALFWMHLSVEKALKAHVAVATRNIPPLIHNLVRLAELAGVTLLPAQDELCNELNKWQSIARYGAGRQREIDPGNGTAILSKAREFREWLITRLQK